MRLQGLSRATGHTPTQAIQLRPQTSTAIVLVLFCLGTLLAASARAQSHLGAPMFHSGFARADVERMAQELAKKPYTAPREAAKHWANLNYDQFRDVRVSQQAILWRGSRRKLEAHFLPVGWLFKNPVDIHVIDNGVVRQIAPGNALFQFGPLVEQPKADTPPIEFSGFRLNGPINRSNVFDEIAVFQGASYFRAVSKGQVYGLSARGLAIDTAQPKGEEFPFFRSGPWARPDIVFNTTALAPGCGTSSGHSSR